MTINLQATTGALSAHNARERERRHLRTCGALAQGKPSIVLVAFDGMSVAEVFRALAAQIGETLPDFLAADSSEAFRRIREQER